MSSQPTPVVVRPLVARDSEALGDLLQRLADDSEARHFHPHPLTRDEAVRLATGSSARKDEYFGAFDGDRLAGYGMLRGWDEGYAVPSFGVAVHPDHRGMGIGRQLLRYGIARARARGATTLMLKVHAANPNAKDLYVSEGFAFTDAPDATGQLKGTLDL